MIVENHSKIQKECIGVQHVRIHSVYVKKGSAKDIEVDRTKIVQATPFHGLVGIVTPHLTAPLE